MFLPTGFGLFVGVKVIQLDGDFSKKLVTSHSNDGIHCWLPVSCLLIRMATCLLIRITHSFIATMGKRKQVSSSVKVAVIALSEHTSKTQKEIASYCSISQNTVSYICAKCQMRNQRLYLYLDPLSPFFLYSRD